MEVLAEQGHLLIVLACIFGFFMAWGVGANDVANAMGTSVGAKALTMKQAILIAMIFEFLGAYLAGGEVTSTIRKGIIDPAILSDSPQLLAYGMLASLLAAGIWLLIASVMGWPVSTTHTIVGAIIGFAVAGIGPDAVKWSKVWQIFASWVISPLLAGLISYMLYKSVRKLILDSPDPFDRAQTWIPFYMFAVGFLISMVTLVKGLKYVISDNDLNLGFAECSLWAGVIGLIIAFFGRSLLHRVHRSSNPDPENQAATVEKIFAILMVFTACSMAFAHGSNDVANAVGPLAAVVGVVQSGAIAVKTMMPGWILLLGAIGIVIGLATYGYRVMATIGKNITHLTPSRGFAAELAAATTVVLASATGIPVSTTHTLVGAVLGIGCARGISTMNLRLVGSIVTSWVVTLPAGALLSILFFHALRKLFE